jgi:hypothetical protein
MPTLHPAIRETLRYNIDELAQQELRLSKMAHAKQERVRHASAAIAYQLQNFSTDGIDKRAHSDATASARNELQVCLW